MNNAEADRLTEEVLATYRATPDPRLREVMTKLVRHLHAFIKDTKPTFEEWMQGVEFLTKIGQACAPSRQEFILLSDVLGVSMLVDTVNHGAGEGGTDSTVLGPLYAENPPVMPLGADVAPGLKGQPLYADGVVRSIDGKPIPGAIIDIWQADEDGFYDMQKPGLGAGETELRARFRTDSEGRYFFKSIVPKFYSIPVDGPVGELVRAADKGPIRPAHLHFLVKAPGYDTLVTHLFVKGDPYINSDAVYAVKPSLIVDFAEKPAGTPMPDGHKTPAAWRHLNFDFGLKPAQAQAA
jgi:hydroxyquinol 1,2-dioxygenase